MSGIGRKFILDEVGQQLRQGGAAGDHVRVVVELRAGLVGR
jgi:hypothetical protein